MTIPRFDHEVGADELVAALRRAGCAIIEALAPAQTIAQIDADIAPYMAEVPMCTGSFTGLQTQRTSRLVAKSPASHPLLTEPLLMATLEQYFRAECYQFTLHATGVIRIHPGQPAQSIHRDDSVYPFKHPCPPTLVVTIWAMSEFTRDNGATQVVPGSHRWDDVRRPSDDEIEYATMPQGSVLLLDGATYHSGGGNQTRDQPRTALQISYGLGWLRPFENPQLAVPPALAKTLPAELQALLGYRNHGFLGHYELCNPMTLLGDDSVSDTPAGNDLFDDELAARPINRR